MNEQHLALEDAAKRTIAWINQGLALKEDALKAYQIMLQDTTTKDAETESREALRAEVEMDQMAVANKVAELIYKGDFDVATLWDAFPELWQKSSEFSAALLEMKGTELQAAANKCLVCTACTACATCGACALCLISGVAATAGITVTSTVSSTQAFGS